MATAKTSTKPAAKKAVAAKKTAPAKKPAAKKAAAPAKKPLNIKIGSFYTFTTPRGTTGRIKVDKLEGKPGVGQGVWVVGTDKDTKQTRRLRPANLSA